MMLFRLGCLMAAAFLIGACAGDESTSGGTGSTSTTAEILTGDSVSVPDCPDQAGYSPTVLILSPDEVHAGIEEFKSNHPGAIAYGGVFSRTSLDELLCITPTNGVGYYLLQDPSEHGKPGKIYIVLAGVNMPVSPGDSVSRSSSWYMPNNWCPPTCVKN